MSPEFKVIVFETTGTKTSTKHKTPAGLARKLNQWCTEPVLSLSLLAAAFSLSLYMYVCMCARNNKTREFYLNRQFAILLQMWRPPRWQRFTSQITDNASPLLAPTTAYNGESCAQKAHRMCIRAAADKASAQAILPNLLFRFIAGAPNWRNFVESHIETSRTLLYIFIRFSFVAWCW